MIGHSISYLEAKGDSNVLVSMLHSGSDQHLKGIIEFSVSTCNMTYLLYFYNFVANFYKKYLFLCAFDVKISINITIVLHSCIYRLSKTYFIATRSVE